MAAGFDIDGLTRHPAYAELRCTRRTLLGAQVRLLIALSHSATFKQDEMEDLKRYAEGRSRQLVLVAGQRSPGVLTYQELFEAVGGQVPSWRALAPEYSEMLVTASSNALPVGESGEAWLLFECLVQDGLEFSFGRRAYHHGGASRGTAVSDIVAVLPDLSLEVIDTKATANEFSASTTALRALGEYLQRQRDFQRGHNEVYGSLVVSSSFAQGTEDLKDVSLEFAATYGGPVAFLSASVLAQIVEVLSRQPDIRNSVRWRRILRGGEVTFDMFRREIESAQSERVRSG